MANLKYGSTGDEVKKLQESLGFTGNDVDGIFGQRTQKAVMDYQKANNLAVNGIVDENTIASLYGSSNTNNTPAVATPAPEVKQPVATGTHTTVTSPGGFTYGDFRYEDFAPSDIVNQANTLIQQQQASKPGAYTPVWQDEADAYLSQYQNRDPFSYDFNSDALYNQYKDNYIRQGQMAMMDTMGQAAALNGGYGSSYAQTVGQQVYNQYLGQLNEVLPELAQMARDRYDQEGQDMLAMYDLYMGRDAQEYGKYQDSMDAWYQEMDRLTDNYNMLYNREWEDYVSKKSTAYDEYLTDRQEKRDDYLNNLNKEQTAAELLASAGNYDRLKAVYGLTDDEVAAIKKANTPKSTGGTGYKVGNNYKTLSWEEKDKLTKIFGGATSTEELGQLAGIYGSGYNPDDIDQIIRYANPNLYYQEQGKPVVDNTDELLAQHQANNRLVGGGGGYKSIVDRLTY